MLFLVMIASGDGAVGGCGDGVVSSSGREQPWEVPTRVVGVLPAGSNPIFGIVWTDPLRRADDIPMPPRRIESDVAAGRIRLFGPPPPAALFELPAPSPSTEIALLAMGELVIVDDVDGDGLFRIDGRGTLVGPAGADAGAPVDRYLAGTTTLLIYVARPFSDLVSQSLGIVPPGPVGYRIHNFLCAGPLFEGTTNPTTVAFDPQTSLTLIERRTCMRTHTP